MKWRGRDRDSIPFPTRQTAFESVRQRYKHGRSRLGSFIKCLPCYRVNSRRPRVAKCASKWGFFWRRPSYHSHLEPLHFPIFRLFEIYFEKTKEVRFPLSLIVFRLDVVRLARRYCANGAGSVRALATLRFENDRSRTRSDFDFVNKMRIFRPNPTRSLVGVTQSGAVTLRMVSGRFHFHPEAQLPALFRQLCRQTQSSLAAKRHVSYMI